MNTTGEHYCGECPFFKYEDTDGIGLCSIKNKNKYCGDTCGYLTFDWDMSNRETEKILHYSQKWRRGGNIKMLNPRLFGLAIDGAIRELRRIRKSS